MVLYTTGGIAMPLIFRYILCFALALFIALTGFGTYLFYVSWFETSSVNNPFWWLWPAIITLYGLHAVAVIAQGLSTGYLPAKRDPHFSW